MNDQDRLVGEFFFWYQLTRAILDKIQSCKMVMCMCGHGKNQDQRSRSTIKFKLAVSKQLCK